MYTDPEPVMISIVWQQNQTEMFPVYPFTMEVNILVFVFFSQ